MYGLPAVFLDRQKIGDDMRIEKNEYTNTGRLINGYDYDNQAWVIDGRYVRCGHPEDMNCGCYGREYEGEETKMGRNKMKQLLSKWEYDSTWERIITHENGVQEVIFDLTGDPEKLRISGPILAAKLNELRGWA